MSVLNTTQGTLYYNIIGKGDPIIFFHGGPGLSHKYFRPYLDRLSSDFQLVFFDQMSCGESEIIPNITAERTVASTIEFLNSIIDENSRYYVVAHSWGAYLLASCLKNNGLKNKPFKVMFLSPTPFDRQNFDLVGTRLFERVPVNVKEKIGRLSALNTDESGTELMNLALPYYSGKNISLPEMKLEYRISTYNSVSTSLDNFDLTDVIVRYLNHCYFIFGSEDYISSEEFMGIFRRNNEERYTVEAGGHFSFAENTSTIVASIRAFFSK